MRVLQTVEVKNHFLSLLKDVEKGNEIAISYSKKKPAVAVIIPYEKWIKKQKRVLGTLEGKMTVEFTKEFNMTDEELINL